MGGGGTSENKKKRKEEEKKNQSRRIMTPKITFQNVSVFSGFITSPKFLQYSYGFKRK